MTVRQTLHVRTVGSVLETRGLGCQCCVLCHPAAAIAMLASMLGEKGEEFPARRLILSGKLTKAVLLQAG